MTQQQVSGSSKTLVEAIRDGEVEQPALMSWNKWQQWRRDKGLRPTAAVDGEATTGAQESALWKSIMLELYGDEWPLMLASVLVEPQAPALAAATPLPSEPGLVLAAGAELSQPSVPSQESAAGMEQTSRVEESPGSGHRVEESPGSGQDVLAASPGSGSSASWKSSDPGTPTSLSNRVLEHYVPGRETLDRYQDRVRKQAAILSSFGQPLAEGNLEVLLVKSEYELRLYEEAKDLLEQTNELKMEYKRIKNGVCV